MRVLVAQLLLLKAKERFRLSATANNLPAAHLLRVIHADEQCARTTQTRPTSPLMVRILLLPNGPHRL